MHAWEQIQKTLNYIEEHLNEKISIENLAKIAALSPFYYQRLFSRLVKKPVAEYIKLRRMAKATDTLLNKEKRILDIALDFGFSNHEQFTRTFKDTFGITPEDYRRSPVIFNRMTKPQLLLNYTLIDEGVPLINEGIVLEISRRQLASSEYFVGLEAITPIPFIAGLGVESGKDPLFDLLENFHTLKKEIPDLFSNRDEIGVAHPCEKEGYFSYFAGTQVHSSAFLEHLKSWELSAVEYIVCTFEAENFESLVMDVLYKAQQYLFNTWLPNHKLATEPFSLERYTSQTPSTAKMEIWVKPSYIVQ